MDKVVALLEKYVQWLALGIGALFLVLMGYSYLIQEPVTVKVGSQELTPAQLDLAIAAKPEVKLLKSSSESTKTVTPAPTIPNWGEQAMQKLALVPELPKTGPGEAGGPQIAGVKSSSTFDPNNLKPLTLTPAAYVDTNSYVGRAVVAYTVEQPPVVTPPVGAPAAAPLPAGGVNPAQVVTKDVDYTTHKFTIPIADLVTAMKNAGMDPTYPGIPVDATDPRRTTTDPLALNYRFQFLAVELRRQEKSAVTGDWDPSTEIVVGTLPTYQLVFRDLPRDDPNLAKRDAARYEYIGWAAQYVRILMQPPFPQATSGQPWYEPGTAPVPSLDATAGSVPIGAAPAFVPSSVPRNVNPPPMMDRPGGVGMGVPGVGLPPNGLGAPGAGFVPGVAAQPGQIPGEGQPQGEFNPAEVAASAAVAGVPAEVAIYGHDITCQPGRTYRYKLRYTMRNPYWRASNTTLSTKLSDAFVMVSPDSAWTKPLTVPPRVQVFVKAVEKPVPGSVNTEVVQFDVFVSQEGQWKAKMVRLTAGDLIAKDDRDGKWNSGWSVVDVRKDARRKDKYFVLLADATGAVKKVDPDSDAVDPIRIDLMTKSGMMPAAGSSPGLAPGVAPAPAPAAPNIGPPQVPGREGRPRGPKS